MLDSEGADCIQSKILTLEAIIVLHFGVSPLGKGSTYEGKVVCAYLGNGADWQRMIASYSPLLFITET